MQTYKDLCLGERACKNGSINFVLVKLKRQKQIKTLSEKRIIKRILK